MAAEADLEGDQVAGTLVGPTRSELTADLPAERPVELEDLEQAMVEFAAASRRQHAARVRERLEAVRGLVRPLTIDRIDLSTTAGLRDRALLLVGFALGLRRAELVALERGDLFPAPDGMRVRIARSKTDQTGQGRQLLLTYAQPPNLCAVRVLRACHDVSAITSAAWRALSP